MTAVIALLLATSPAHAHANIKSTATLAPRSADTGLKTPPCGGIARTNSPKVVQTGSTITVEWQETINHPGRFEFSLSQAGDQNFKLIKTVIDDQNDPIVGTNYHNYTTTITMPAGVTCTDCTLQMVQVMTENPASPSYYYSCADLKIVNAAGAADPLPTSTTTPSTSNCTP